MGLYKGVCFQKKMVTTRSPAEDSVSGQMDCINTLPVKHQNNNYSIPCSIINHHYTYCVKQAILFFIDSYTWNFIHKETLFCPNFWYPKRWILRCRLIDGLALPEQKSRLPTYISISIHLDYSFSFHEMHWGGRWLSLEWHPEQENSHGHGLLRPLWGWT